MSTTSLAVIKLLEYLFQNFNDAYQPFNKEDLEPNHTHFIMVDGSLEKTLDLIKKLAIYIASMDETFTVI